MAGSIVAIENLEIEIGTGSCALKAVRGVSLSIDAGQALGLVGESGSGKSLTALAIPRLVRPPVHIRGGSLKISGREVTDANARAFRGREVGFIFQEPMTALNPVMTVGDQVGESLRKLDGLSSRAARDRVVDLFRQVGISAPDERFRAYPHEMSGGMRQRAMIAMALALSPRLLIADEPTTALDVTLQRQILDLIRAEMRARGLAVLLISHDLGVVAEIADTVAVMYLGQLVELAPAPALFARPLHPYTRGLLGAMPGASVSKEKHLATIPGTVPSLDDIPTGCGFRDRCPLAESRCEAPIPWVEHSSGHFARCIKAGEC
ncbi:MAG: ABC transporter ATP-binding protein [Deltaproteobacteria bacterium]|nr:ABC transporter ATP-binding protein [Deltaproteobacteria bacterium]